MSICAKIFFFLTGWYILDKIEGSSVYNSMNTIIYTPQFAIFIVGICAIGVLDSVIGNIEFLRKEVVYVPDFEVKYNAKVEVNTVNKEKFDLALEGVFLGDRDDFY